MAIRGIKQITGFLFILLFCQCAGMAQDSALNLGEYVIKMEDSLIIEVWKHPDLEQKVKVDADGNIAFPLIGKIHAVGLTIGQLTDRMTYLLAKDYIVDPLVKINIEKFIAKQTFFVYGEVRSPGAHTLEGKMTLLRAITLAGGLTDFASPIVYIKRKAGDREQKIKVNINSVIKQEIDDIPLEADDIIVIRRRFF